MAAEYRIGCVSNLEHPYLRRFYQALRPYGFEVRKLDAAFLFDRQTLERTAREIEVFHLHWPEWLWRTDPVWLPWRLRGLSNLRRLARLVWGLRELKRRGVALVWTVHNLSAHEADTFVDHLGLHALARLTDLRICHGEHSRRTILARYGVDATSTLNMALGGPDVVEPGGAKGRLAAGLGQVPCRRLLCFGAVREYKGFDLAVEAMRRLGDGYELVVAGRPYGDAIGPDLTARAEGLGSIQLLLRPLTDKEIPALIGTADCVLLPYREITGSAALIEALAHGRGVVASDLPFFREVLGHEPTAGVLHMPGSAESLAAAVREFFHLPAEERSAAALRLARLYEWEQVVVPVVEPLRTAVDRTADRARTGARPTFSSPSQI